MIGRHHFVQSIASAFTRARHTAVLSLALTAGLAGCRHKTTAFVLPRTAHAPIELEAPPVPDSPPSIATIPEQELEPLPPPPPPVVPRRRPASAPKDVQPPVQVASAPDPAAMAIGTLSAGGDSTAQSQQQARDLIASLLKRIAALSARTVDAQRKQISQVQNFARQAQKALDSGDAEGARNLATKAKLLMDDLEKK